MNLDKIYSAVHMRYYCFLFLGYFTVLINWLAAILNGFMIFFFFLNFAFFSVTVAMLDGSLKNKRAMRP